jgi:predicted nucleotidyltransferase component of viral defense system
MTKREQTEVVKQDIERLLRQRRELINSMTEKSLDTHISTINIDEQGANDLKVIDTKIKESEDLISTLYHEMMVEERQAIGYTTFCVEMMENGRFNTLSRIIPVNMKEKYDELFPMDKMNTLPNVEDVDRFLRG